MGMRDGNMIYSPFLHYFLNPAPTTYVESGLHTPWKSCYLTPGLQLQAPSNHSRGRHCPAAGIPREARAARRLIATDGEGGRRTSKGGVTALMRAMRLKHRE